MGHVGHCRGGRSAEVASGSLMFIVLSEQKELVPVTAISGKTFYSKPPAKPSRPADVSLVPINIQLMDNGK